MAAPTVEGMMALEAEGQASARVHIIILKKRPE
jgi:hypothetical protein